MKEAEPATGFSLQALRDASSFPKYPGDAPGQHLVPYPERVPGLYDFSQSGAPGAERVYSLIAIALKKDKDTGQGLSGCNPGIGYMTIDIASRAARGAYQTLWAIRFAAGIPVTPTGLALALGRLQEFHHWVTAAPGDGGLADELKALHQDWESASAAVQKEYERSLRLLSLDYPKLDLALTAVIEHTQGLADQARAELQRAALAELLRDRTTSVPAPLPTPAPSDYPSPRSRRPL
jgi:hypothetical protein